MLEQQAARALGVASIGIGLAELAAPRQVEQLLGIDDGENTGMLRALGVRELLTGVDILTHADPTPGVWARVVGDALDGVLLGVAATRTRRPGSFAATAGAVLGIVALDVLVARRLSACQACRARAKLMGA
jgi:hypothetical protein